jgi:hypothetical protein
MEDKHIEQMRNKGALTRFATRVGKQIDSDTAGVHVHGEQAKESVRVAEHKGHSIVVRTRYEIEVDRKPVVSPVIVDNFGRVSCHALPNYSFLSALDLVKQLIDTFPEDFGADHGAGAHKPHLGKPSSSSRKKSTSAKQGRAAKTRSTVQKKRAKRGPKTGER